MSQDENRENIWEDTPGQDDREFPPVSEPVREDAAGEVRPIGQDDSHAACPPPVGPQVPPFQPVYPPDSPYSQPFYRPDTTPQGRATSSGPAPARPSENISPAPPYERTGVAGQPIPHPKRKRNAGLAVVVTLLSVSFIGAMGWLIGIGIGNLNGGSNPGQYHPPSSSQGENPDDKGNFVPKENPNAPVVQINQSPEGPQEGGSPVDGAYTPKQIYEKVSPSVVSVTIYRQGGVERLGYGSGVVLSEDGYIVTNAHVLMSSQYRFVVQTSDGRDYEAEFIAASTRYDLGVLKIDAKGLTPARFGDSDQIAVGDVVYGIGNPAGPNYASSLSHGLVSGINRSVTLEGYSNAYYIQTDAAINPGNSGGALINAFGQVIGISNSKIAGENFEGMGFAIPTSQAIPLANEMMRYGKLVGRVKIGATFMELDSNRASIAGLPQGLYVNSIEDESGLKNSGIEVGDVILRVQGERCFTADDLREHLQDKKAGDTLVIGYYDASDNGKSKSAEVRLIEDVDSSFYG
ncbi:MAG: trypsin-like serine protease [Clostridiales bacterium]|nr:trypsin-like serine protease [Clostridiales bacterium]